MWTLGSPDWLPQRLPKQMQGPVVFGALEQSCADEVSTLRTIHCIIAQGSLAEWGGGVLLHTSPQLVTGTDISQPS